MKYKDLFTVAEAATLIGQVTGDDKFYIAREISVATRLGKAKIYDSRVKEYDWSQVSYGIEYEENNVVPLRFSEHPIHFHQLDITSLLKLLGYHPSIQENILNARPLAKSAASPTNVDTKQTNEAAPAVVDSTSSAQERDLSFLATRQQLIEAFGIFTGMDATWFNNLKDTPALRRARKVVGQGGRGHIEQPLFCPLTVMLWLADSKRRKGLRLGADKAWELLEKNFPKVYNANSVGDPRTSD